IAIEYRPGSRLGRSQPPSVRVTVVHSALVALLVTVTVAPGTGKLLGSMTVPARPPNRSCASAGVSRPSASTSSATVTLRTRMFSLLAVASNAFSVSDFTLLFHVMPQVRGEMPHEFQVVKNYVSRNPKWRSTRRHGRTWALVRKQKGRERLEGRER